MELGDTCRRAADLLTGDRMDTHGEPIQNFERAARIFEAWRDIVLSGENIIEILECVEMATGLLTRGLRIGGRLCSSCIRMVVCL